MTPMKRGEKEEKGKEKKGGKRKGKKKEPDQDYERGQKVGTTVLCEI
jgi:hypothetical protein